MSLILHPPPVDIDFKVIHVSNAAQIFPKPEYIFTTNNHEFKLAKKIFGDVKIILPMPIRGFPPDKIFEIFIEHLPELYDVYKSLVDTDSKETFCGFWSGCISNQISLVKYANTPQYICSGFLPKSGDIVIDCGAYDGATAARFANMGCKVYGFEMNKQTFDLAAKLATEKNFVVENLGLGCYSHEVNYSANGAATQINLQGSETAKITTIDSYVGEKNLPRVDFIKMDVEGAELDILKGATITITKYKPILALSAYHRVDDFWTLTKFIKSLRSDYEFGLRQYATTIEDIADWFSTDLVKLLENLGLSIDSPSYEECVLFAR